VIKKMTTANTAILATHTGTRLGAADSVARIIPVLYSPVMNSTPSTPTASCAR